MTLLAIGINHQTAPVGLRERVAFADHSLPGALAALRGLPSVREVALLSTCNRTELYAIAENDGRALVPRCRKGVRRRCRAGRARLADRTAGRR